MADAPDATVPASPETPTPERRAWILLPNGDLAELASRAADLAEIRWPEGKGPAEVYRRHLVVTDEAYIFLGNSVTSVPPTAAREIRDKVARKAGPLRLITGLLGAVSIAWIGLDLLRRLPGHWDQQVAVFLGVATVPLFLVEGAAGLAVRLGRSLLPGDHTGWFENPGAILGMLERILFLGSLVGGYPEFIAVWFVYKGIEGWASRGHPVRTGRLFQLMLINSAASLAGVGLAWISWNLLGLPVHHR